MTNPTLSVIVTTYNSPGFLKLVLDGLRDQVSPGAFEVLVADDGSGQSTADVVDAFRPELPIRHVWQADEGFRAARVRNLAARSARGPYLVFLDGDCIPQPTFIRRHRQLARPGRLVAGERIFLSESVTRRLVASGSVTEVRRSLVSWLFGAGRSMVDRPSRVMNLGRALPRDLLQRTNWSAVEGANMSLGMDAFRGLNGFDEEFKGWGFEDWDLAFRAVRGGLGIRDGRFSLGVFHLWHPIRSRSEEGSNWVRFEETRTSGRKRARVGFDGHDPVGGRLPRDS